MIFLMGMIREIQRIAGIVIQPIIGIQLVAHSNWRELISMQKFVINILFILLPLSIFAQSEIDTIISGKISYQSVENIYVSFESTQGIVKGDTLFLKKRRNFIPVIEVNYISSKSVSGIFIGKSELKINDEVYAFVKTGGPGFNSDPNDSE